MGYVAQMPPEVEKSKKLLLGSSKVTIRGQITIPEDVRRKYGIKPGDIVYFIEQEAKLIIQRGPLKF